MACNNLTPLPSYDNENRATCIAWHTAITNTFVPQMNALIPQICAASSAAQLVNYIGEFVAGTTYNIGDVVSIGDVFYISKIDGNTDDIPSVNWANLNEYQSGTNANGTWVRFKDGTFIYYGDGEIAYTSNTTNVFGSTAGDIYRGRVTVTLPMEALGNYSVSISTLHELVVGSSATSRTTTDFLVSGYYGTSGISKAFAWIAVGRWY